MTNTKMLETVYALKNSMEADVQKTIDDFVRKNLDMTPIFKTPESIIATLIQTLKDDISAEEAKKNGKNNQLKAAKAILKNADKNNQAVHFTKIIDGVQYICDGYILAKIVKPFELPELPENLKCMDYVSVLNGAKTTENELIIPNLTKLKAYIKQQKAEHKKDTIRYNFGENKPLVNAERLATTIDLMDGEFKAYFKNISSALYFKDENENEALLMPMSKLNILNFVDVTTEI